MWPVYWPKRLMDAETLLLTANTETVYSLCFLDLKSDGPTVVEAPPKMLGIAIGTLQRFLVDIGPLGPDTGSASVRCAYRSKFIFVAPSIWGTP